MLGGIYACQPSVFGGATQERPQLKPTRDADELRIVPARSLRMPATGVAPAPAADRAWVVGESR